MGAGCLSTLPLAPGERETSGGPHRDCFASPGLSVLPNRQSWVIKFMAHVRCSRQIAVSVLFVLHEIAQSTSLDLFYFLLSLPPPHHPPGLGPVQSWPEGRREGGPLRIMSSFCSSLSAKCLLGARHCSRINQQIKPERWVLEVIVPLAMAVGWKDRECSFRPGGQSGARTRRKWRREPCRYLGEGCPRPKEQQGQRS